MTTRDAHVLDVRTKVAMNALLAAAADLVGDCEAAFVGTRSGSGSTRDPGARSSTSRARCFCARGGCARPDEAKTGAEGGRDTDEGAGGA